MYACHTSSPPPCSPPSLPVDEYIVSMERNLEVLMKEPDPLSEEEVGKFGKKNYEEYPVPPCVCVCVRGCGCDCYCGWLVFLCLDLLCQ